MIIEERETVILSLLREQGVVSIHDLVAACPGVSAVTLRRDLSRLEDRQQLKRTHGGAARAQHIATKALPPGSDEPPPTFCPLILPPVGGPWGPNLRHPVTHNNIPLPTQSP